MPRRQGFLRGAAVLAKSPRRPYVTITTSSASKNLAAGLDGFRVVVVAFSPRTENHTFFSQRQNQTWKSPLNPAMNTLRPYNSLALLVASLLLLPAHIASAQIWMDVNGTTAGFGNLSSAVWNTTNTNWTTNSLGTGQGDPPSLPLLVWSNDFGTTTLNRTGGGSTSFPIDVQGDFTMSGLSVIGGGLGISRSIGGTSVLTIQDGGIVHIESSELQILTNVQLTGNYTKTGAGDINYSTTAASIGAATITIEEGSVRVRGDGGNPNSTTNFVLNGGNLEGAQGNRNYTIGNLSGTSGDILWAANSGARLFTITQSTDGVFGGRILAMGGGGTRGVVKNGEATLTFTGDNSYNGTLTINAGTIEVGNGGTTGNLSTTDTINNAALIFNRSNAYTYAQNISGTGTVTQAGGGTMTLSGTNSYVGATFVNAGTLLVNGAGSLTGTSGITVNDGATFRYDSTTGLNRAVTLNAGGTFAHNGPNPYTGTLTWTGGTLAGTNFAGVNLSVGSGQTLSPGNSPDTMVTGNQIWTNGGNLNLEFFDFSLDPGTGFDTIAITGTLDLTSLTAGGFNINLWSLSSVGPDVDGNAWNFDNLIGGSWLIVSTTEGVSGFNPSLFAINVHPFNGTGGFSNDLGGGAFSINLIGNNLFLEFTPIPEPSAWMLLGAGLCVVSLLRRRKQNL